MQVEIIREPSRFRAAPERERRAYVVPIRRRRGLWLAAAVAASIVPVTQTSLSGAAFSGSTANSGPSWSAATLQPVTGAAATGTCTGAANISQVGSATGDLAGGQITLTVPAAVIAGDLLLAHLANDNESVPPTGFTQLLDTTGYGNLQARVYQRVATAADAGKSYAWTLTGGKATGGLLVFRGTSGEVAPADAAGTDTGKTTVLTAPSMNVTVAGSVLVSLFGLKQPDETFSTPPGTTHVFTAGTNGTSQAAFRELRSSTGATGTRTTTASAVAESIAQSVVVKPGSGVPAIDVSWTPTTSPYATGYAIARDGIAVATVTPASASTWRDNAPTAATHTYTVRAITGTWRSDPATFSGSTTC